MKKLFLILALMVCSAAVYAQKQANVWEFGLGVNVQSLERATLKSYTPLTDHTTYLNLDNRSAMAGLNIYVAREMNSHFYLDFQTNMNFASDPTRDGSKGRFVVTPAIGVQWRLGSYMRNKVIDPFVRCAIAYQYRNFNAEKVYNLADTKEVAEENGRSVSPVIFGAGSNLWITDRWGVALEADYMLNPQSGVRNQWQGVLRVVYRLGGKSIVCF